MEKELTPQLLEKAKQAKTAEELLALAKENGVELTAEEANTYFAKLNVQNGELSDDELDSVAGGSNQCRDPQPLPFQIPDDELDITGLTQKSEAEVSAPAVRASAVVKM